MFPKKFSLAEMSFLQGEPFFLNTFFFSLSHSQGEKYLGKNFHINIRELININISADGHPFTFV